MTSQHPEQSAQSSGIFAGASAVSLPPAAIEVSDLTLMYPASGGGSACTAIEGVSVRIASGSIAAMLGESGSGKSTFARFLAARGGAAAERGSRVKVLSGDAQVLDTSLSRLSRRKSLQFAPRIGFLEQDGGARLNPDLSVGDLLLLPAAQRSRTFDAELFAQRAVELLTSLDLPHTVLSQLPFQLSKGQRQRVALAQSLMLEPSLLILDEPTLGVDVASRPLVLDVLADYLSTHAATALIVSHDIDLLERLVDTVFVLQQGALVGSGAINEIFSNSEHDYVQRLASALRSRAYDDAAPDD